MVLEYPTIRGIKFVLKNLKDQKILLFSFLLSLTLFIILLAFVAVFFLTQQTLYLVLLFIFLLFALLVINILFFKLFVRAAELADLKFSTPKLIDWFILSFKAIFVNLFCWYDKKLLIVPAIGFLLSVLSLFIFKNFLSSFVFAGLFFISYLIAILIHSIRLIFFPFFFLLEPKQNPFEKSAQVVKGQTMEVFLPFYVFFHIIFLFYYSLFVILISFLTFIGFFIFLFIFLVSNFLILSSMVLFLLDKFLYYSSMSKKVQTKTSENVENKTKEQKEKAQKAQSKKK